MTREPGYWAVIPAAGIGQRMGGEKPKQYLRILDKTILEHSLSPFCGHPLIRGIAVVTARDDIYWQALPVSGHSKIITAPGGTERCHSVLNGLIRIAELAHDRDWALVHDAARPCVTAADIDQLIAETRDHPVGGILALPVVDTVKQGEQNKEIRKTVNRENLWRALTPQMFRLGLLQAAIASAVADNRVVTDEAQALELKGHKPLIVPGGSHNIKVSMPEDIGLAEFYLKKQAQ